MLESALMVGPGGRPLPLDPRTRSTDWDEVQAFCREVYMPYRVKPLMRLSKPDATMISARVGDVTFSRFSYGVPIHLDRFDPTAGNILVLNTLRGALRHQYDHTGTATTEAGESFVVDCSRTDYWLDADADHMQLNLTIPHRTMELTAERWFGFVPDDALWTSRVHFGGPGSRWQLLLDYVTRSMAADLPLPQEGGLGRHLEEMICLDLLREWAAGAGYRLDHAGRSAAPWYVRKAEEIMAADARNAPTIGEVALNVGITARALSEGFRRFRGVSPREWLAARRLEGVRRELMTADPDLRVAEIASSWGYVNFGAFASAYRRRFGEVPSATRRRAPR